MPMLIYTCPSLLCLYRLVNGASRGPFPFHFALTNRGGNSGYLSMIAPCPSFPLHQRGGGGSRGLECPVGEEPPAPAAGLDYLGVVVAIKPESIMSEQDTYVMHTGSTCMGSEAHSAPLWKHGADVKHMGDTWEAHGSIVLLTPPDVPVRWTRHEANASAAGPCGDAGPADIMRAREDHQRLDGVLEPHSGEAVQERGRARCEQCGNWGVQNPTSQKLHG